MSDTDALEEELDRLTNKLLAIRAMARRCREAQKVYFRERTNGTLSAAKQAEAELDKLLT